jgi:hypothetical protein
MDQWLEAGKLEELKGIISKTPPPYNPNSYSQTNPTDISSAFKEATETTSPGKVKSLRLVGVLCIIGLIISFVIYENNKSNYHTPNYIAPSSYTQPKEKTPEELRAELLLSERGNPDKYLNASVIDHYKIFGNRIIDIRITNNATLANFKDAILIVTFHSKTKTIIETKRFVIYEYCAAGRTISTTIKTPNLPGTVHVETIVETATPVN